MCHRRTNKESVLSADVGPPETNIIYRSKCNMSIYIIIGGYIIKIEIWFTSVANPGGGARGPASPPRNA